MNIAAAIRIRQAWQGGVSGSLLGKPLEVLSFQQGPAGVKSYQKQAGGWTVAGLFAALVRADETQGERHVIEMS